MRAREHIALIDRLRGLPAEAGRPPIPGLRCPNCSLAITRLSRSSWRGSRNVALEMNDGGNAPFIRPPWPGADELPKTLASGDEATFYLDELRKVAEVHAEHGGAKWVTAKIGGGIEFHGEPIDRKWLDGWVPKA